MEEIPFKIRSYSKADLAMMYNPDQCVTVALKTLSRWIQTNTELRKELDAINYNKRRHSFTPKEIEAIVRYIGQP